MNSPMDKSNESNAYVSVADDAPNRCQSNKKESNGDQVQCHFARIEGSKYCKIHSNSTGNVQRDNLNMYRLTKYQNRLDEFAGSNKLKNLTEEIGILRMVMEETLNKCDGATDLLCYSDKISGLAGQIEKLVNSCHKLDLSIGNYLDKTQAINLVETIIKVIENQNIPPEIKAILAEQIISETTTIINDNSKTILDK